jgi:MoaA/NifB/PqqE/SkfB family radical SAM enzyme
MTPQEWKRLFENVGDSVFWATLSGGEPFLYNDIIAVYHYLNTICRPAVVNIPTNGQWTDRIVNRVRTMKRMFPDTQLTINVSIDHCDPKKNDEIRGLPGYYEKAVETIRQLLTLEDHKSSERLTVGIHSVVSKYNISDMKIIRENLVKLLKSPDDYVTEIAENRVELQTVDSVIGPDPFLYRDLVPTLVAGGHGLKQAFRRQYYEGVAGAMMHTKYNMPHSTVPCYAGYATCQVTPSGDIWPCCMLGEVIGNLRDEKFDFGKIWNGEKAQLAREQAKRCSCPMANVSYTNAILHPPTMAKILKNVLSP